MNTLVKSSFFTLAVITSNISVANNISTDFINNEVKITHNEYLHGSPEVAIYAMESLVRLLQTVQSNSLLLKINPSSLSLSYIRLGFLYEKSGLKQKADIAFSKAVASYKSSDNESENIPLKDLKSFVRYLDARIS
jgi:hypothetical protein